MDAAERLRGQYPDGLPAGTILEEPEAYLHVRMGYAEPADAECAAKAAMTPEAMAAARHGYDRIERGIHPDDYAAFDAGQMTGYHPDGSWIPGPNAVDDEPEEEESQLWMPEDYE